MSFDPYANQGGAAAWDPAAAAASKKAADDLFGTPPEDLVASTEQDVAELNRAGGEDGTAPDLDGDAD